MPVEVRGSVADSDFLRRAKRGAFLMDQGGGERAKRMSAI